MVLWWDRLKHTRKEGKISEGRKDSARSEGGKDSEISEIYSHPQRGATNLAIPPPKWGSKITLHSRTPPSPPQTQDSEMDSHPPRGENNLAPPPPQKRGSKNTHHSRTPAGEDDTPELENPPRSPKSVQNVSLDVHQAEALAGELGGNKGPDEVLADVAQQKKEQKATKADDADVPEHIWEEHLLNDGPTLWVVKDFEKLRKAMDLLRQRMLRWWKHKVTTSFIVWSHTRYPKLAIWGKKHGRSEVRRVGERYQWTPNDPYQAALGGREAYREWWKSRSLHAGDDIHPAANAIERAAKSWWNWDEWLPAIPLEMAGLVYARDSRWAPCAFSIRKAYVLEAPMR
jgi:hypothetical protein